MATTMIAKRSAKFGGSVSRMASADSGRAMYENYIEDGDIALGVFAPELIKVWFGNLLLYPLADLGYNEFKQPCRR